MDYLYEMGYLLGNWRQTNNRSQFENGIVLILSDNPPDIIYLLLGQFRRILKIDYLSLVWKRQMIRQD